MFSNVFWLPVLNNHPLNMMKTNMNKLLMVTDEAGLWSCSWAMTPHIEPGPRGGVSRVVPKTREVEYWDISSKRKKHKIVSSQTKICDTPFNQKFFDLPKCVFCDGTDRHTDGHGNSMTKSAQWADSVNTAQSDCQDKSCKNKVCDKIHRNKKVVRIYYEKLNSLNSGLINKVINFSA